MMHRLAALGVLLTGLVAGCSNAGPVDLAGKLDSGGTRINYKVLGDGEPVILLHGYLGDARTTWFWTGIADELARDFRVIAIDVRGHGGSGKPPRREDYGPELLRDILRLMEHFSIDRTHLVGFSMGGDIALAFLAAYPERTRRVVMTGSGWYGEGDWKYTRWQENGDHFAGSLPEAAAEEDPAIEAVRAASAVAYGMLDLAVDKSVLRDNTVPTLLLVGADDVFRRNAELAFEAGANMTLRVLPGYDHSSTLSHPEYSRIVRDFLRGQEPAPNK